MPQLKNRTSIKYNYGYVKNKRNKKIHKDKNGRDYIKEAYFVGGKMKFHRVYIIDGIPGNEFYKKNATDLDFFLNGDFELINSEIKSNNHYSEQNKKDFDLTDNKEELPF